MHPALTKSFPPLKILWYDQSEYLDLVSLHEDQTIQLFVAREALAEARENGNEMEKTVAWLKASHAEERAERSKLSSRVNGLKSSLDRERVGHAFAVKQYLLEMDERWAKEYNHNRPSPFFVFLRGQWTSWFKLLLM